MLKRILSVGNSRRPTFFMTFPFSWFSVHYSKGHFLPTMITTASLSSAAPTQVFYIYTYISLFDIKLASFGRKISFTSFHFFDLSPFPPHPHQLPNYPLHSFLYNLILLYIHTKNVRFFATMALEFYRTIFLFHLHHHHHHFPFFMIMTFTPFS